MAAPVAEDRPFRQKRAVVYRNEVDLQGCQLRTVRVDRDGKVLINTDKGLLKGYDGRLLVYRELAGLAKLDHFDLELLGGKFVFLTNKMLLPLHGAGVDYLDNTQNRCTRVAAAGPGHYLLLSSERIIERRGAEAHEQPNDGFSDVLFDHHSESFVCHGPHRLARLRGGVLTPLPAPPATITGVAAVTKDQLAVATDQGLFAVTPESATALPRPLPWPELTCVACDREGRLWMGSNRGAFSLDAAGHVNYYAGRRWLPDDRVIDIHADAGGDAYVLTAGGLSRLEFPLMTLADKAAVHLRSARRNHIRYGFISDCELIGGDEATAFLHDNDNDGLWSAMYLAAESFRYAVTEAVDARENARDGFDAMERLVTITGIPGFEARAIELDGFKVSDPACWRTRPQRDFEWKGTTSSDEIVGSLFFHSIFYDTVAKDDPALRRRVSSLVASIVDHILDHDLYLVDIDGRPTRWGRWNPEYVNTVRIGGDRRLNSVEILSFLQLAWHVTRHEKYKQAFYRLVRDHGYAENTVKYLPDPMGDWNHSDDELYWLSYYNLLKHCFDDDLRKMFLQSAREHIETCRRKKNPLWNFIFGAVTGDPFDLEGSVWTLREYPLDNRNWRMQNSHRKDIQLDRRYATGPETDPVLSPAERPIHKWNTSEMVPDGGGDGNSPESGAEYLLPYWMGRYYGFISAELRP